MENTRGKPTHDNSRTVCNKLNDIMTFKRFFNFYNS